MALFWRIFGLNAVVFGAATALLLWAPVTVSVPVALTEAVVLIVGLGVMLVANAVLLHVGLAPLERVTRRMATVDLLRPGQRLSVAGHGGVPDLVGAFNDMLDRLETERATSSARAVCPRGRAAPHRAGTPRRGRAEHDRGTARAQTGR